MKRIAHLALLLSFCASVGSAQDVKPAPAPAAQQRESDASAEEKVYREDEVDVKAELKGDAKPKVRMVTNGSPPPFTRDCPARGQATMGVVVDKAGKVAAVTVVMESGCAVFDKRMVKQAWKAKFSPALKDGQPVSQETTLVTGYEWPGGKR